MKYKHQYIIESPTGTETTINGKKYLYFAGTGYFGLNQHPELAKAACEATLKFGISTATSRALTGTSPLLIAIEKKAAEFFNTEDAVYLPSGYLTNIAGLKALDELKRFDVVFLDEFAHYSLSEACEILNKKVVPFKHRDMDDLKFKLEKHLEIDEKPVVATDGLFPIKAQIAPIDAYDQLLKEYDGLLWIDDAHGMGIIGDKGRGCCEYLKVKSERIFIGGTLSKAFGAYGGIIPGSNEFIAHIKTGSVMTGSSSPTHAAVAAGIKGLELVQQNPEMREKLWENARYLKQKIAGLGIQTDDNCMPVVAFQPGDCLIMEKIHQELMHQGIYIQYAKYRGSGNEGILRIVVFSTHTKKQIDFLAENLKKNL